MQTLKNTLLHAGLVQFGHFIGAYGTQPALFNFQLLPSYPDLLQGVAHALADHLPPTDFLVSTGDSFPLGQTISLTTRRPLVYSRGSDHLPGFDLVGAYDVGHPALIITNVYHQPAKLIRLADQCRKVGLEVKEVICLLAVSPLKSDSEFPVHALIDFRTWLDELSIQGHLPTGQARAVMKWLDTHAG